MSLEHLLGSQLFQCKVHSLKAILLTTAHPLIDPVSNHLIISSRLPSDYITGRFPKHNAPHVSWTNIFTKSQMLKPVNVDNDANGIPESISIARSRCVARAARGARLTSAECGAARVDRVVMMQFSPRRGIYVFGLLS